VIYEANAHAIIFCALADSSKDIVSVVYGIEISPIGLRIAHREPF
jgi:hypothetical protein